MVWLTVKAKSKGRPVVYRLFFFGGGGLAIAETIARGGARGMDIEIYIYIVWV